MSKIILGPAILLLNCCHVHVKLSIHQFSEMLSTILFFEVTSMSYLRLVVIPRHRLRWRQSFNNTSKINYSTDGVKKHFWASKKPRHWICNFFIFILKCHENYLNWFYWRCRSINPIFVMWGKKDLAIQPWKWQLTLPNGGGESLPSTHWHRWTYPH